MNAASPHFVPGTIQPLASSTKLQWELGQVRQIACGGLSPAGHLQLSPAAEASWQLSVRSIEKAGSFHDATSGQNLTLIAGDFVQLEIAGQLRGLEPLRPLKIDVPGSVTASQPTEELLVLHLAHDPQRVRATVRIVELSKKRDQYLFDGQLGVLLQGQATVLSENQPDTAVQLRDTVYGGDDTQVRLLGRGFLAVVSLDSTTL